MGYAKIRVAGPNNGGGPVSWGPVTWSKLDRLSLTTHRPQSAGPDGGG